jgi:hypothetical protein
VRVSHTQTWIGRKPSRAQPLMGTDLLALQQTAIEDNAGVVRRNNNAADVSAKG